MSSNPTPTGVEDAAALERVRTRLVNTPDGKLPSILYKLLPRLVSRFHSATAPSDVDPHLAGIFDHLLERILLNTNLLLGSSSEWVAPLLQSIVPATATTAKSQVVSSWMHYRYVLPILEVALARCTVEGALAKLMIILQDIHSQALAMEETGTEEDATMEGNSNGDDIDSEAMQAPTKTASLQKVWKHASWMVVEQIAKQSNVQPILDWNFVGDHWDGWNAPTSYKKIAHFTPTPEERETVNHNQDAVYSLFLDIFTFDPITHTDTLPSRWQFRRRTGSIQEDYVQSQREQAAQLQLARQTDLRTTSMLVNQQSRRRRNPTSWHEAELKYWRALQNCLQPYAVQLFSGCSSLQRQQDEASCTDREDMLRILTGRPKPAASVHSSCRPKASKMHKVNDRKRAQRIKEQERKQVCRHSLTVGTALIQLLLGEERVQPQPRLYRRALMGSQPGQKARPPLPSILAQRVFGYLLTADFEMDFTLPQNGTVAGRDLEIFMELLTQLTTVSSLHNHIAEEIYELIGAQTPAPTCWEVHFLWKVSSQIAAGGNQSGPLRDTLSRRAWDAATKLLDGLQDISFQRFQRQRQLAGMRNSGDRRIHEHRERLASKNPFVAEALQARSEAYLLLAEFVAEEKVLSSALASSPPNTADGRPYFDWDLAARLLNCAAFDLSTETQPALQEACSSVLSVYRKTIENATEEGLQKEKINTLLLPLLKACISSSDWSRDFVLQWAEDILVRVDPGLSHVIFECLAGDEVPTISRRAREAFRRLSSRLLSMNTNDPSSSREDTVISFWDPRQAADKDAVKSDLQNRKTALTEGCDGLSTSAALLILQGFDFSVLAAQRALVGDFEGTLCRSGCACTTAMDVDRDTKAGSGDAMCEVCLEDIPRAQGFALACNHRFCVPCWQGGMETAHSVSPQELVDFSCLQHDCNLRMTQESIAQLEPELVQKFEDATLDCFLRTSPDYRFCPGADCPAVAQCVTGTSTKQQQANCYLCDTHFCFGCGSDPHPPVACDVRLKFKATANRLVEHENNVENKTIACPNCSIGITKNGGCNHMTCSQCGHEFCWICLSANWQDHVCNVFDSLNGVDDVQRVQFFSHRVDAHEQSAAATRNLLANFEVHANDLQYHARYCDETHLNILRASWKVLAAGRDYLAASYIAAYGMSELDPTLEREFQAHQSQLQVFVEQLSMLCDNVQSLCELAKDEKNFRVQFKGVHFCAVAVSGYTQRTESFMKRHFN